MCITVHSFTQLTGPAPPRQPSEGSARLPPAELAESLFTCHRSDPRDGCEILGGRVPLDLLEREQSLHLGGPARHEGGWDLPARRAHAHGTCAACAVACAVACGVAYGARRGERDGVRRACGGPRRRAARCARPRAATCCDVPCACCGARGRAGLGGGLEEGVGEEEGC